MPCEMRVVIAFLDDGSVSMPGQARSGWGSSRAEPAAALAAQRRRLLDLGQAKHAAVEGAQGVLRSGGQDSRTW
jgi:hypothetical protein